MGAFQYYNNLQDIPEPFKKYSTENIEAKSCQTTEKIWGQENLHSSKATSNMKNRNSKQSSSWDFILFYFIINYLDIIPKC